MWRFWTCWAGWCLSFPAAERKENPLSSSLTFPPKLMIPVANSTLYVALPGPYQCPSIRGKDYTGRHLAQHHLPPPTAGIKGKVPEETGKISFPRCHWNAWPKLVPTWLRTPWKWGNLCYVHSFKDSNRNWNFIQNNKAWGHPSLLLFFPFFLHHLTMRYLMSARSCAKY